MINVRSTISSMGNLVSFLAEQFSIINALAGCGILIFALVFMLTRSTKFLAFTNVPVSETDYLDPIKIEKTIS